MLLVCYAHGEHRFVAKEKTMKRYVFAIAVAALTMTAVSGTSQAVPIAPLPSAITAPDSGLVTQARWYGHWHHWRGPARRHCWWRHGYRHCW
jgi:hypothetical protein